MATRRWLGRAAAVAQLETITVDGTIAPGEDFTVTINGKSITFTTTTTTIAHVVAGLVALLNASTYTEFTEITWAADSPDITGLADTAGVPFTVSVSTDSSAGTIGTVTTTAATGPNHWNNAINWDGGAVPANSDAVYIDNSAVSILYGLDQSAVTLASLTIGKTFTGYIGLPRENSAGYPEYREQYLKVSATTLTIGGGTGSGSGRIKINLGSNQTDIEVRGSGNSRENGIPAVLLLGTHASNVLDVQSGTVGLAFFGGDVSTLTTLRTATGAKVWCGAGSTLGTVSGSGEVEINAAVTTVTQASGVVTVNGSGNVGTWTLNGGRAVWRSSGTITTASISAMLDCSGDASSRTITNCTLKSGGTIADPHRSITYTNGILLDSTVSHISAG